MCKWRFKIHFSPLNLSSKIPAGVRIRTSKLPYMDICAVPLGENSQFQAISDSRGCTQRKQIYKHKYKGRTTPCCELDNELSPDDGQSWSKLIGNNKIKIQGFISIYLVRRSIPALGSLEAWK